MVNKISINKKEYEDMWVLIKESLKESGILSAEEILERKVKRFGRTSGYIPLPSKYVGREVRIIIPRIKPLHLATAYIKKQTK